MSSLIYFKHRACWLQPPASLHCDLHATCKIDRFKISSSTQQILEGPPMCRSIDRPTALSLASYFLATVAPATSASHPALATPCSRPQPSSLLTRRPRGALAAYLAHRRPTTRGSGGVTAASPHCQTTAPRRVTTASPPPPSRSGDGARRKPSLRHPT